MRNKKENISISDLKMRNHVRETDSRRRRHNIKTYLVETFFENGGWIEMAQNKDQ